MTKGLTLEQYREWLKEHGNNEEHKAADVAERIIEYQTYHYVTTPFGEEPHVVLFPRQMVKADGKRYECDLVIEITWRTMYRKLSRMMRIGVEFKEWDFQTVVAQALERKPFFDFMYIATRPHVLSLTYDPIMFNWLIKEGIGWVLWDDDLVYLLLPAKKRWMDAEFIVGKIEEIASTEVGRPRPTILDYLEG